MINIGVAGLVVGAIMITAGSVWAHKKRNRKLFWVPGVGFVTIIISSVVVVIGVATT